jgi:cytochrome P450
MTDTTDVWESATAHSTLARLRQESPVHRVTMPNGKSAWLVTKYADARAALADPRLMTRSITTMYDGLPPDVRAVLSDHLVTKNGSDHIRLRRLIMQAFTTRRVEQLSPRIQQITDELLDQMAGRQQVDLMAEYALPLPLRVICELLGIPREERGQLHEWSSVYLTVVGVSEFPMTEMTAFVGYLRELIASKEATPDDSMLTALITARDQDNRLSKDELASLVYLLFLAGHETTMHLIGNGMYLLLLDPARADRLRAHPETLPAAVEEFLRYESPAGVAQPRFATEPVELGGATIATGEPVLISLLSANRDPAAVTEPDRLRPTLSGQQHLAFGHGVHRCIGAPLARLEARIAIGSLLRRYPGLRLAVDPATVRWQPGIFARGLVDLPVNGVNGQI